jgi:Family of unknown function (DUF6084)
LSIARAEATPRLGFTVDSAEAVRHTAAPTVSFRVRVDSDLPVRSLSLTAQIRIETTRRAYDPIDEERLVELFGERSRWGQTLRSLLWTHAAVVVPPFTGSTTVDLPVACTYDFEVASAKYFHALGDGEVPLAFLFSGTVFYSGENGLLRTALISWDHEAEYRMPISVWKGAIENHFPGSAWIRVRRDVFDRLYAFKAQRSHLTWEAALEDLLEGE